MKRSIHGLVLLCLISGLLISPVSRVSAQVGNRSIYREGLSAEWKNWSWRTTTNFGSTAVAHESTRSVSVQHTAGRVAFNLHATNAIRTADYSDIRFWIHGGSAGGQEILFIVNKNESLATSLTLQANTWTRVIISLKSVGSPATITDLSWKNKADTAKPVYYIDDLVLVRSTTTPAPVTRFNTLPPGSRLPTGTECAALVRSKPENKGMNRVPNATRGSQRLAPDFFANPRANTTIGIRVTGYYTGTTDMVLQWAACKWGIDEDIVRAQAAIESWWRMDVKGDWTGDASMCAPGHGLGADGNAGVCPESWGILQNRYPYMQSSWPGIETSTAFNVDTAYAIWRACYEGYETWLNDVEHGSTYGAGDAWGCVGRWYAGRWLTQDAYYYIGKVQEYLNQRIWEMPEFQEP